MAEVGWDQLAVARERRDVERRWTRLVAELRAGRADGVALVRDAPARGPGRHAVHGTVGRRDDQRPAGRVGVPRSEPPAAGPARPHRHGCGPRWATPGGSRAPTTERRPGTALSVPDARLSGGGAARRRDRRGSSAVAYASWSSACSRPVGAAPAPGSACIRRRPAPGATSASRSPRWPRATRNPKVSNGRSRGPSVLSDATRHAGAADRVRRGELGGGGPPRVILAAMLPPTGSRGQSRAAPPRLRRSCEAAQEVAVSSGLSPRYTAQPTDATHDGPTR